MDIDSSDEPSRETPNPSSAMLAVRTSANASPITKPTLISNEPNDEPITPTQTFRFMSLPAELRLHIYEWLLLDKTTYIVPLERLPPARPLNARQPFSPAILRVCKAMYHEALPVLYGSNTWMIRTFPIKWCVKELLAYSGQKNAGLIRRVLTLARVDTELDQAVIKERYEAMGIKWDQLNLWGARITGEEDVETVEMWLRESQDWVEKVDGEQELKRLGIHEAFWFEQKIKVIDGSYGVAWVVRKGSTGRRGL